MYKKMIVATDVSAASDAVVGCLSALKTFGTKECLLLQCLSYGQATSASLAYDTEPLEGMLDAQKKTLENQGFAVEARVVVGAPRHEVVRIAKDENYQLIVVGTQGHSLAGEKVLGGVAYGVINKTVKPVLVIPIRKKKDDDHACEPTSHCRLNERVLFATDFSETADSAFTHIEKMVASHGVKTIQLLHVQDKVKIEKHLADRLNEFNRIDVERFERLKAILQKAGAEEVGIEVSYGMPAQEIIARVAKDGISMVVMGTQGRGFLGEMLLGSVSHVVARSATVPVLLIPANERTGKGKEGAQ